MDRSDVGSAGAGGRGTHLSRAPAIALAAFVIFFSAAPSPIASTGGAARSSLPGRFFGVNSVLPPTQDRDARLMHRSGIRIARIGILWGSIQPSRHVVYWQPLDQLIGRLARHGIRAMPFVYGTPEWVVRDGGPPITPRARGAWSRFLRAVINRYGAGGSLWAAHTSLPRQPIRDLQVWNEPNFPSSWDGRVSARSYARLLRASAHAVRAVSSRVRVVLAGLGPGLAKRSQVPCWKFLNRLYKLGAGAYFDVAADHPYAADSGGAADQLRRVSAVMRRHHDRSPLYVTEAGWSSGHLEGSHLEVGPKRQAKLLTRTVRFVVQHAGRMHIKLFAWFDWRDPARSAPYNRDGAFDFGLRQHNERAKPAWRAYLRWTRG